MNVLPIFLPPVIQLIKDIDEYYKAQGMITTPELIIEYLENVLSKQTND